MILPIGDTPNPENYTPWGNWLLIAINLAVYLLITFPLSQQPADLHNPALREYLNLITPGLSSPAQLRHLLASLSSYDLYVFTHGYKAAAPELSDLFYSLFLHGGFFHLAGNMLFLWIYGDNVEHRLGHLPYLAVYLACGVAATLFFAIFTHSSMTPLVGASGAISGALGLYFIFFPRNQIKVFLAFFPLFFNVFMLPARWVLGFYLLIDNLLPFLTAGRGNVAHGAHIGGFLAGLLLALLWNRLTGYRLDYDYVRSEKAEESGPTSGAGISPFLRLREAISAGHSQEAFAALSLVSPRELFYLEADETVALAKLLRTYGHLSGAEQLLRNYIRTHGGGYGLGAIFLAMGELRLDAGEQTAALYYLHEALEQNPDAATAQRARQLLERLE